MNHPRIVSFLPAATEMVYALGLGDQLLGVSHECDFPAATKTKPVIVRPALALEKMTLREIDVAVAERIRSGGSLYQVDETLLCELKPDLILTQNLCQVCATSGNDLTDALKLLQPKPEILWMTPHSLTEIFENIRELSQATGRSNAAETFIAEWRERLEKIAAQTKNISRRPRVFCMEWADPVYCAGHWVPEMVQLAGGIDELVYAVDANSYFARPGPRVVDGVELLAHLIHPELFNWNGPDNAFRAISTSNSCASKTRIKTCPQCGQTFECKMGGCWCDDFPPHPPSTAPGADCLCLACLAKAIGSVGKK